MNEHALQQRILVALSEAGCLVWRNNTGAYNDGGRYIKYGLCVGSSDIIGATPCGKFLAVEVKTAKGRVTQSQQNFIDAVNRQGGVAGVARSVDDALRLISG